MNWLIVLLIRVLEGIFLIGIVGSALVFILTTVEDVRELFGTDEKSPAQH